MRHVSLKEAKDHFAELGRLAESGETIIVTRHGKPVFDLVPHKKVGGLNHQAGKSFLLSRGISDPFPFVAADFDEPLPEDFLLQPLRDK